MTEFNDLIVYQLLADIRENTLREDDFITRTETVDVIDLTGSLVGSPFEVYAHAHKLATGHNAPNATIKGRNDYQAIMQSVRRTVHLTGDTASKKLIDLRARMVKRYERSHVTK